MDKIDFSALGSPSFSAEPKTLSAFLVTKLVAAEKAGKGKFSELMRKVAQRAFVDVGAINDSLNDLKATPAIIEAYVSILGLTEKKSLSPELAAAIQVKAMFEEELAERNNSPWALWDVFCCVLYRLLWGAESAIETGMSIDPMPAFEACSAEFVARLREWYVSEISDEMAEENAESLISPAALTMAGLFGPADAKTTVKAQGEKVTATLTNWLERLKGIHVLGLSRGAKEGRTLGAMTRQQMRDHMQALKEGMDYLDTCKTSMQAVHDDMSAMVDASEKPKGEMAPVSLDDPGQALLRILRLRTETSAMMTQ